MISDKDSDSAISSDGEFMDACKINVFDEDDSYINQIEKTKRDKVLRDSIYRAGMQQPQPTPKQFISLKMMQSLRK